MAVAPTAMRAAAAAPPLLAARVPLGGPAGAVDAAPPLSPLDGHEPLLTRHGAFGYDTLSMEQGRARSSMGSPDRPIRRNLDTSLFTASSEAFAIAFTPHPQYSIAAGAPGGPTTKSAISHGIATYEATSAVIHNELAPRGEQLSVML